MTRVIMYGLEDHTALAHFYLSHDSRYQVAAFTVTREFQPTGRLLDALSVPADRQGLWPEGASRIGIRWPQKRPRIRLGLLLHPRTRGVATFSVNTPLAPRRFFGRGQHIQIQDLHLRQFSPLSPLLPDEAPLTCVAHARV
jgi:hypothetical protein